MKSRNYHYYGPNAAGLQEEYAYIGRHAVLAEDGHLIVFALPPKKEKKNAKNDKSGNKRPSGKSDGSTAKGTGARRGTGYNRVKSSE